MKKLKILVSALLTACSIVLAGMLAGCSLSRQDAKGEATTQAAKPGGAAEEATTELDELEVIRYRVGKIKEKAEAESAKATKEDLNEAANYIRKRYEDCYDDPGAMEHMIYYGYLLFYRFGDGSTEGDMGHSGATAAELVYTEQETADSLTVKAYKEDVEACIRDLTENKE